MCFCLFILFYYCFISCILYVVILSSIMCCFVLSLTCVCFRVSDSLSTMTSSQAEINGMMVMVHSTLRLNFFNYGSSCQTRPITLTTLYEMMMDLTWRIELILSKYQSSSRGAPRVVMLSLPHLTSPASVTLGASQPWPHPHSVLQQHYSPLTLATLTWPTYQLLDPPVVTVP